MKKIITLIVLLSICCCGYLLLYACLDSNQKVLEAPVISKDLFQKVWVYQNDQGNAQTVFMDKNKNRIVFVTYEGGFYVLDRKEGAVLCQHQPSTNSGNSKYRPKIVKAQGDIILMTNDGGNDIFTYDLNDCETLAEIHLDDLSYIYDYTIDLVDEKIVVLTYTGVAAFDPFTGDLAWEIKDYALGSQRTSGYLKVFNNYLFIQGEGEIRSIDPETGMDLFAVYSPTDGMYIGGRYMGIDDLLLAKAAVVDNIKDRFIVALNAKTGELLYKTSIPNDETFDLYPIKVVNNRKLLYGDRPPSEIDVPGFCALYEIKENGIHLLWQNEEICSNGVYFGEWFVASPYPRPPTDSKYSSTYYMLDVFTGEIMAEQKFNMSGVTGLYSDDENLYFLRDHDLIVYKSIK